MLKCKQRDAILIRFSVLIESCLIGRNIYFNYSFLPVMSLKFQGSDPRAATCRGKLQSKRSKLNMEINKELMLRSGAEKLFK